MKLAIFGSTGPSGLQLVQQSLDQGHHVTAFARTPSKLDITHERLRIVQGDVLDPEAVQLAVAGHDAVLSALGAGVWSTVAVREQGTQHIIDAMQTHGVKRLIVLSSYGVGDSYADLPFFVKYVVVPLYLRRAFRDCDAMERVVRSSGVDWTVTRPPFLTHDEGTGRWHDLDTEPRDGLAFKISRADVATFMLGAVGDSAWHQRVAAISN